MVKDNHSRSEMFLLVLTSVFSAVNGEMWYPLASPINPKRLRSSVLIAYPMFRTKATDSEDVNHQMQDLQLKDIQSYRSLVHLQAHESPLNSIQIKSTKFKYSTPVELSSWRPMLVAPKHSLLLTQLKDKEGAYKSVRKAVSDPEKDYRNLILPIGIKKLHNPQLRRPRKAHYVFSDNDLNNGEKPVTFEIQPVAMGPSVGLRTPQHKLLCYCSAPQL